MPDLKEKVLQFDTKEKHASFIAMKLGYALEILNEVENCIDQTNHLPPNHTLVYALRVAAELSELDEAVLAKVYQYAYSYNKKAGPGNSIDKIPLYQRQEKDGLPYSQLIRYHKIKEVN